MGGHQKKNNNNNCPCRKTLQGIDQFGCCYIIIKILNAQKIEDCYKTPIQPTIAKLNTADGPPMSALGMTALHWKFTEF